MKTFICSLLLLLLALPMSAQLWQNDFAAASDTARAEGKNVVLVFAGSDWCAPCIKLERTIWEDSGFQEAATKDFVFVKADFPRRKANQLPKEQAAANALLAEKYNTVGSFPLVVILNPDGEVLGQTGYKNISPAEYLASLQAFVQ